MEAVGVNDLGALIATARASAFVEREVAAMQLASAGMAGTLALAAIAEDGVASVDARVTALRHLGVAPEASAAVRACLRDAAPVIRLVALEWAERVTARDLLPDVEALVEDAGRVFDLDSEHGVGDVARRVAAALTAPA